MSGNGGRRPGGKRWTAEDQQELADFLGVRLDTVKNYAKQGMPAKRKLGYQLDKVVQWLRQRGPWRARTPPAADPDDPLVFAAANTPGLERLRKAKAEIAELELSERQRRVVSRDEVRDLLALVASYYRRAGETLQRRFGRDAAQVVLDAVEQAEEAATKRLSAGNGGSD